MTIALCVLAYLLAGFGVALHEVRRNPSLLDVSEVPWESAAERNGSGLWLLLVIVWPMYVGVSAVVIAFKALHRFVVWYADRPTPSPEPSDDAE